jgi:hypothetical protein
MPRVSELIRERLLADVPERLPDLDALRRSEWSPEFESLMRNRLIMGAIRYGRLLVPGKAKYDRVASMMKRLAQYQKDHNAEHLVDVANIALIEFVEGDHDGVIAVDDSKHHAQRKD